jgi:DNA-binding LacI/PurR family transcriptional regulator
MSDAIAIGAMSAARALGLRISGDLSFVGFDDLEIAGYTVPPLTTVEQPIRAKGETAMRMLLAALEGHPTDGTETVVLPTSLIVRASTGPPPRGGTQ